jgi:hypothetical protein
MGRNDALSHQSKNGPVLGYCVNWVCRLKARSEKNEKNRCYVAD